MDTLPPQLFLGISGVILVLGFLTALAKNASIGINDSQLNLLVESDKRAKRLSRLLAQPSGVIGSLEFWCSFFSLLFTAVVIIGFFDKLDSAFSVIYIEPKSMTAGVLSALVLTVLSVFVYLVFGVFVPERIAAKYADSIALSLSGYTAVMTSVGKPFLWLPTHFSNLIARIFGVPSHDLKDEITEEEIRMMVDIGSEKGTIDDDEKEMIHNIFELDDKPVEDIMTHRTEVCILWMEDSLEDWKKFIDETNHTRYPVCDENIDNVIGVVNTRDFYRFLLDGGQKGKIRTIMREPYFVPDSMKADELFSMMQHKNNHIVMVMDEYGGFKGLVTQEDLLEEIVGELSGEYDEPEEEQDIERIDENTWRIKGWAEIEDVEEALGAELPEGEYNTFAGLVLDAIETLPEDGDTVEVEIGPIQVKVTSVMEHRIEEAVVCLKGSIDDTGK